MDEYLNLVVPILIEKANLDQDQAETIAKQIYTELTDNELMKG